MSEIFGGFIDDTARRPRGQWARKHYGQPKSHMRAFEAAMAALAPRGDDVYLEIGCGGGYFLDMVLAKVQRAAAIDHSADMAALARQKNQRAVEQGRLEVVHGDAEKLPWPDESFTCTANTAMWFFVRRPEAVLAELRRVLKPGGRIVIATARKSLLNRLLWAVYGLNLYDDQQMAGMLGRAGFVEIKIERQGLLGQLATARKA
ncbi:Methyltransferase type 11 [Desulfarculus baarsii DSM 2075]|uniref:Methyltransferase type 11 n=1 Tax=Desulfarculus baarsii (strain ATCC 33931 / DSM 2075 / LMG 7858 / VKM B-1802 / 2st14) TaxID=644282 RepID=E1QDF8_DESB2|nr:class I SAM-dependent methyltransferase [Desulfarculus baarsii]ADK83477.1 Methyltransferase type 11 [Desulfarculus baarsii DSM 2075]